MSVAMLSSSTFAFADEGDATPRADVRAAKRIQRTSLENDPPIPPASGPSSPGKAVGEPRSSFASRRRSGLKPPLGPRPPQFNSPRRIASDASSFMQTSNSRNFLQNATSEPFLGLSARRSTSNFNFNSPTKPSDPRTARNQSDVSFATSNASTSAAQESFGRQASIATVGSADVDRTVAQRYGSLPLSRGTGSLRSGNASPVRQRNPALRAAQISTGTLTGAPVSTPLTVRTRRQGQVPSTSGNGNDQVDSRKSIGPGLSITTSRAVDASTDTTMPPTDQLPQIPASNVHLKSMSKAAGLPHLTAPSGKDQTEMPDFFDQSTMELSESDATTLANTLANTSTARKYPDSSLNATRKQHDASSKTPTRPQPVRNDTSGSSDRRQSTISIPFSGLGARTISPTDAKRRKRTSAFPRPPPMPVRSPTPELTFGHRTVRNRSPTPELTFGARPDDSSPLISLETKQSTLASARATPESSQRLSGYRTLSALSKDSFGRRSSSSQYRRPSLTLQGARLSPRRSGSPHSATAEIEEVVPPVPAIPKAYESPSDAAREPFFSSLNGNGTSADSKPASNPPEKHDVFAVPRPQEGFTSKAPLLRSGSNERKSTVPNFTRQNSHRGRLPPIQVLPLSRPTVGRIASFSVTPSDNDVQDTPATRRARRTPTTPMTASKATFSTHDFGMTYDLSTLPRMQSSTSHHIFKSAVSTANVSRSSSPDIFHTPSPVALHPTNVVPLQRMAEEQPLVELKDQGTSDVSRADSKVSKTRPLRSRAFSSSTRENSPGRDSSGPEVVDTSTRRKLGFGWRRSSSKVAIKPQFPGDASAPDVASTKGMGTPSDGQNLLSMPRTSSARVSPASAAVDSSLAGSLKKPSTLPAPSSTRVESESVSTVNGGSQSLNVTQNQESQAGSKSATLSKVHRVLGTYATTSSLSLARARAELDDDDQVAEKEIRRLASKKRDFEAAAREVDELQRVASAKASARAHMTPGQAIKVAHLNTFERGEIIDYDTIHFCGSSSAKKIAGDLLNQGSNFGYDDERGDYNIVAGDHLAYRYEVVDLLGKGSFGQVVRCIDHKNGGLVAVKIIRNKKRFHQQALVEVNILQRIRDWDPDNRHGMVNFTQSFYFRGHLCIATELLGINLYEFIKAHDFSGFSIKIIRRFTKQLLNSLCLLHSRRVIHCDLKPENILLAHPLKSEIKLIDFGSSCFDNEKVYTYIQSRFYRSPEVILGMDYGMPIDMWSVGCIIAELFTGYPIFPGENEQEQLACIMEIFGPPEKHLIERSSRKKLFFDSLGKPRLTVSSKGKRRRPSSKTLQQALKSDDEAFLDFITRCLRWDPDRRMKPDDALSHDFITGRRTRSQQGLGSRNQSPARRPPFRTPVKARPLPDAPAAGVRSGIFAPPPAPSASPVKSAGPSRRHSVITATPSSVAMKRNSNGAAVPSALPRSTPRSVSGKPDLASAAAIVSLQRQR